MRKSLMVIATGALVALVAALAAPASAQVDVDVSLNNPGGSRTLYVEDLAGNSLTALDFGNARSLPFRVRVVDDTMDTTSFTVSSSMTNLYHDNGGLDFNTKIGSDQVSLGNAADPLNVLDPSVLVQPVFDTVSTITDSTICTVLSLTITSGSCTINTSNVTGLLQTVSLPVDLTNLTALPLVPQQAQTGPFTNPSFQGVGASDPAASGAPTATSLQVIAGNAQVGTVLTNIQTALNTLLGTESIDQQIDTTVLTDALRTAVGPLWDTLTGTQVTTVVNDTVATVQSLVGTDVLGLTGTYMSFPTLNVNVPSGSPSGTYRGTLVVTGLQ